MDITKADFNFDTGFMSHRNPQTGAQAMIKCTQRTSGMMMGNRYALLIQTPMAEQATAEYVDLGRGSEAHIKGEAWLKTHGFEPFEPAAPIGRRVQGRTWTGETAQGIVLDWGGNGTVWVQTEKGAVGVDDWRFCD